MGVDELRRRHADLSAFERHGVQYVLVGCMAMAAQGIVRATRDIDVSVSADESNVARLRAALREVFGDPEIDGISAADLAGEYPAIHYAPAGGRIERVRMQAVSPEFDFSFDFPDLLLRADP